MRTICHPDAPGSVKLAAGFLALTGVALAAWLLLRGDGDLSFETLSGAFPILLMNAILAWGLVRLEQAPYWYCVLFGAMQVVNVARFLYPMFTASEFPRPFQSAVVFTVGFYIHTVPTALILVLTPSARRAFRRRREFRIAPAPIE